MLKESGLTQAQNHLHVVTGKVGHRHVEGALHVVLRKVEMIL